MQQHLSLMSSVQINMKRLTAQSALLFRYSFCCCCWCCTQPLYCFFLLLIDCRCKIIIYMDSVQKVSVKRREREKWTLCMYCTRDCYQIVSLFCVRGEKKIDRSMHDLIRGTPWHCLRSLHGRTHVNWSNSWWSGHKSSADFFSHSSLLFFFFFFYFFSLLFLFFIIILLHLFTLLNDDRRRRRRVLMIWLDDWISIITTNRTELIHTRTRNT